MSIRHVRPLAAQVPDFALVARLRMPHLRREFSFSSKPIIQVMARLPATFDTDFVGANSDFLVARRIRY
jgi:hypothetical protein